METKYIVEYRVVKEATNPPYYAIEYMCGVPMMPRKTD
jgi:hypothetical protein